MGQKINPSLFRLGSGAPWYSRWFADPKKFSHFLEQDVKVRKYLEKKLRLSMVDRVDIERTTPTSIKIIVETARPGVVIGRGGSGIDVLREELVKKFIKDSKMKVEVVIREVANPAQSAKVLATTVALDIEKRVPFRRAMKNVIEQASKSGIKGVKVKISGRLNGAEIARRETLSQGSLPLHTLRANVDYGYARANTTYGSIGCKVWLYKGLILNKKEKAMTSSAPKTDARPDRFRDNRGRRPAGNRAQTDGRRGAPAPRKINHDKKA